VPATTPFDHTCTWLQAIGSSRVDVVHTSRWTSRGTPQAPQQERLLSKSLDASPEDPDTPLSTESLTDNLESGMRQTT
jgi:hypothetical protein